MKRSDVSWRILSMPLRAVCRRYWRGSVGLAATGPLIFLGCFTQRTVCWNVASLALLQNQKLQLQMSTEMRTARLDSRPTTRMNIQLSSSHVPLASQVSNMLLMCVQSLHVPESDYLCNLNRKEAASYDNLYLTWWWSFTYFRELQLRIEIVFVVLCIHCLLHIHWLPHIHWLQHVVFILVSLNRFVLPNQFGRTHSSVLGEWRRVTAVFMSAMFTTVVRFIQTHLFYKVTNHRTQYNAFCFW